jgi:hypothetical protein
MVPETDCPVVFLVFLTVLGTVRTVESGILLPSLLANTETQECIVTYGEWDTFLPYLFRVTRGNF